MRLAYKNKMADQDSIGKITLQDQISAEFLGKPHVKVNLVDVFNSNYSSDELAANLHEEQLVRQTRCISEVTPPADDIEEELDTEIRVNQNELSPIMVKKPTTRPRKRKIFEPSQPICDVRNQIDVRQTLMN
jgi:hypothetical protein